MTPITKSMVGQAVYIANSWRRSLAGVREERLEKVGTKWATTKEGTQIDRVTWTTKADYLGSVYSVFPTREKYEALLERDRAWSAMIKLIINQRCPEHLTTAEIQEISARLKA